MFQFDVSPEACSYPWELSYGERLKMLGNGHCKIAFYYGNMPDSSTYRYRVYNMVQVLRAAPKGISASYFHRGDLEHIAEIFSVADIIIIARARYCHRIGHAISMAKNKGKKLIYDIDDLVFDTRYIHLILNTIGVDYTNDDMWQYWFGDISRYSSVLALCDEITTTNDYLADKVRDFTKKNVTVIPNFLNREQLEISKKLLQSKREGNYKSIEPVYLGYFSGTRTHNQDFQIITDAVTHLFKKYDNIRLRITGLLDLDERLTPWSERIEFQPYLDFVSLQKSIAEIDINLIPLQDNEFTNCKSELKYFEAGIVGTVSIASPTYVYVNAIRDGHNGFLANTYEWAEKIEQLLNNKEDYSLIAENAYQYSERNYSWSNLSDQIVETFSP